MNQEFSFRMMQGKGGKSGHIRKEGSRITLSFRQLPPDLPCTLYRDGRAVDTLSSSPQGTLQFTCRQDGFFFLCHGRNLLLWEEGEDSHYFRAQQLIPKPEKAAAPRPLPPSGQADQPHPPAMQETPAAEAGSFCPSPETGETTMPVPPAPLSKPHPPSPESPPAHLADENLLPAQAAPQTAATLPLAPLLPPAEEKPVLPPACVCEPVNLPAQEEQPQPLPLPALNPRSPAPSVMTLPPLRWPPSIAHLQAVFAGGTPCRPFSAPGFRCVRAPSQTPALPYSIMGYQAKDSRVCALLHAVPGHPLIPPRGFEGAPYRDGHFIRIQPLPAAQNSR